MEVSLPRVEQLFYKQRLTGPVRWLHLLYIPFGLCLAAVRFFTFLHVLIVYMLLPSVMPLRSFILRTMSAITGIVVTAKDHRNISEKPVILVSNSVSLFDAFAVDLVVPSALVPGCGGRGGRWTRQLYWLLHRCGAQCRARRYMADASSLQEALKLVQTSDVPVLVQPEGATSNGCVGLLKYSPWAFSLDKAIQPVTIQVSRPMGLAVSTISSSPLADLWWSFYSPFTLYTLRVLPLVQRQFKESPEQFASRVQKLMATALGLKATNYTDADKTELAKKLARKTGSVPSAATSMSPRPADSAGKPSTRNEELERMAANIKAVMPQVPADVIRKDLLKTCDPNVTMTNLLEGTIAFKEEQPVVYIQSAPTNASQMEHRPQTVTAQASCPQPPKAWHAADSFAKTGKDRHQSLAERKQLLLEGARQRYIEKHGLGTHYLSQQSAMVRDAQ